MKFEALCQILTEDYQETIAIVPGSFKPPHRGHLDMVKQYSKRADKVIVIISDPKKPRLTKTGKAISAEDSKKIFELYIKKAGLRNVNVIVSDSASPMKATYDYVEFKLKNVNVLLGASDKGGDFKRWSSAAKYFITHDIAVNIVDPREAAVKALGDISASTVRDNIDNKKMLVPLLPAELSDKDIDKIMKLIG